jgi:hypothetical protein
VEQHQRQYAVDAYRAQLLGFFCCVVAFYVLLYLALIFRYFGIDFPVLIALFGRSMEVKSPLHSMTALLL